MSVVVAFDCSVAGQSVAVLRDGEVLSRSSEAGRDQSARLLPAIARTVEEAGIGRRDISLLAVTVGPGSFTGVRVGLAAAHGLAIGLDVPVAGVASTSVLLAQAAAGGRLKVAAIDSRLGDWFCAIDGEGQPFLATANGLGERLRGRPCVLIGSGTARLAAELAANGLPADMEETLPDAVALGRLAAAAGEEGWRSRNLQEGLPRPLYLRGVNVTRPDGARQTVDE
jgi:tRNA threonylcarbamoyladenosine biosynthesis protein TsaB